MNLTEIKDWFKRLWREIVLVMCLMGTMLLAAFLPPVIIPPIPPSGAIETRYMRYDLWNGEYKLLTSNTASYRSVSCGSDTTIYIAIKVYIRNSTGDNILISGGFVANASKTYASGAWSCSGTWNHDEINQEGKSVVIEWYADVGSPASTLRATFRTENITGLCGLTTNDWTVYYYGYSVYVGFPIYQTTMYIRWGDSTRPSRIEGFEVLLGAPEISDNNPTPHTIDTLCNFSCTVTDAQSNLDTAIISENTTGSWLNHTFPEVSGASADIYCEAVLPSTIGTTVGHRYYCNDTDGNLADSGIKTFQTIDFATAETLNVIDYSSGSWGTTGTTPYINASDYPSSYITGTYTYASGNITLESPNENRTFIGDVTIYVNYSCSRASSQKMCRIQAYNGSGWVNIHWFWGTSGSWNMTSFAFDATIQFTPYSLENSLLFRFIANTSVTPVYVDHCYFTTRSVTRLRMMEWLFDMNIKRMVSEDLPLVRGYDDLNDQYEDTADAGLLNGALLYSLDNKSKYLRYAQKYADWLDAQPICRVWQTYEPSTQTWLPEASPSWLFQLIVLSNINSSYITLLQEATLNWTNIWIDGYHRIIARYVNGTILPTAIYTLCDTNAKAAAALAYAANRFANETLMNHACMLLANYTLGTANLPPHSIDRTTGAKNEVFCKEDQNFGYYVLAMSSVYYWSGNTTIKNRIKTVAEAGATYMWNPTRERWNYQTHVDTGAYYDNSAVHGFGYADEAFIEAYLIWGNTTWLDRAISDFNYMAIQEHIMINDLICHQVLETEEIPDAQTDVSDAWNAMAKRAALVFYSLNYTGVYQNITYQNEYTQLYQATARTHMQDLCWVRGVDAETLEISTRFPYYKLDIPLTTVYRNFQNSSTTINTLNDLYAEFGNPFTGETGAPQSTFLSVGWNNVTLWNIDVSKTLGEVNVSLLTDSINWSQIAVDYGNGTVWAMVRYWNGSEMVVSPFNSDKLILALSDLFYIYANEAGNWYHTYE